jgi:hypothetical protein
MLLWRIFYGMGYSVSPAISLGLLVYRMMADEMVMNKLRAIH